MEMMRRIAGWSVLLTCLLTACGEQRSAGGATARQAQTDDSAGAGSFETEDSFQDDRSGPRESGPAAADALRGHESALEAAVVAAISELRGRSDANSQVRLALLLAMHDPRTVGGQATHGSDADRARAIVAAGLADPDHALAAWLEALECRDASICDPAGARARLQRIDPDNVAVWLLELDALGKDADPARIDAALARAAQASRHEVALQSAIASVHSMMEKVVPTMTSAERRAMGSHVGLLGGIDQATYLSTLTMVVATPMQLPSFSPAIAACRPGGALTSARHASCVRVFDAMARSGTLISAMAGTSTLVRLLPPGPAQSRAREGLRQFLWKHATMIHTGDTPAYVALRMTLDELPAFDALRVQQNLPTTAPPGWLPSDPDKRHWVVYGTSLPRG